MKLQCELDHKTQEVAEQAEQIVDLTGRLHNSHQISLSRRKEIVKLAEQIERLKEDNAKNDKDRETPA